MTNSPIRLPGYNTNPELTYLVQENKGHVKLNDTNGDNVAESIEFYDGNNQLTRKNSLDAEGNFKSGSFYNDSGKISYEWADFGGADGDGATKTEYAYDVKGNLKSKLTKNENQGGGSLDISYFTEYKYDEYNNVIEEISTKHSSNGSVTKYENKYEYVYDDNGKILKTKGSYDSDGDGKIDAKSEAVHKYSENGEMIAIAKYDNDLNGDYEVVKELSFAKDEETGHVYNSSSLPSNMKEYNAVEKEVNASQKSFIGKFFQKIGNLFTGK